jgi:hypothetical protein
MKKKREIKVAPGYCTRCGKKLNPTKTVWLGYDQRTSTYTDEAIPAEFDQGGFEFGKDCAEIEKRLHKDAQAVQS